MRRLCSELALCILLKVAGSDDVCIVVESVQDKDEVLSPRQCSPINMRVIASMDLKQEPASY